MKSLRLNILTMALLASVLPGIAKGDFVPSLTGIVANLPDGRFSYQYVIANTLQSTHDINEFALELEDRVIFEVTETPTGWEFNAVPGLFDVVWSTEFDYLAPGDDGSFRIVSFFPPGSVRAALTGLHHFDPELDDVVETYHVGPVWSQGDYDSDFNVDGADFLLWQRQYGSQVEVFSRADGNGNGVVESHDLTIWQVNYGESVGSTLVANAAVPEPSSLFLLLAGAMGFVGLRNQRMLR